jgi:hypothetical protein
MAEPQRARMRELFQSRAPSADQEIRQLLEEAGGPELTRPVPTRFAARAVAVMANCHLERRFIDEFLEVARYVANRSH